MENKKKNKTPWWAILLIICAVIISISPAVGIIYLFANIDEYSFNNEFKVETNGEINLINENIKIKAGTIGKYNETKDQYIIEGHLVNNSEEEYESLDITYIVYDNEGNSLGNAYAYIDGLKKNKTWKFKAIYEDIDADEVGSFELLSVNAYSHE